MGKKLPLSFYAKRTDRVAKSLIGKILVRRFENGQILKCVITETEAYLGIEDKACHTYGGRKTTRTEPMWGPAGFAYIYFIYGMYFCLNAVTRKAGVPEAVLIRGAMPLDVTEQNSEWKAREPNYKNWPKLMSGPGKLCRVLGIDKSLNRVSLLSDELWIEEGFKVPRKTILKSPRIGIAYSEEAQHWPLRFIWSSGRLYESIFRYNKDDRSNSSRKNAKNRRRPSS